VVLGEIVACQGCGEEHEILQVSPRTLIGPAPEIEEDWGE
jgi:lysine biosynthesis protein LysW